MEDRITLLEKELKLLRKEREELRREEKEEAALSSRHVITHKISCPVCDSDVIASMASDGETKVHCKKCRTRFKVTYGGNVTILGPKDMPLSKAEGLDIKEDRLCVRCKYYLSAMRRNMKFMGIWAGILVILYLIGFITGWGRLWGVGGGVVLSGVFLAILYHRFISLCDFERDELCLCKDAGSATGRSGAKADPGNINPNLRCKYWLSKQVQQ
ncbi:MAG: hypothetical protein WC047_03605 [Kiritimatiellales bacterium]